MNFEIRMNTPSITDEGKREGNFLLVLGEEEYTYDEEGVEVIFQEVEHEFSINHIVDAIKLIKELNNFSSFDEFYSSLEEIEDENVNRIEDA